MGIYKKSFLILFLPLFLPAILHAQVANIVFTTEPQTIKPSELSGPITIQTQDSSGNSYKTPETIDLEFISASATGVFLGSTGNPVTKTMSTNTSNRTFYYRDSTLGSFALTVNAKGRSSGTTWNAMQTITVSNSIFTTTTSNATSTDSATSSGVTQNNPTVIITTYYSSVPLTTVDKEIKFTVGAGRDRLGSVGSPLEFKAETDFEYTRNNIFKWNFGDGTEGGGKVLSHTYEYPGEYVVMLNVSAPQGQAVARVNVEIIEPEIVVTLASPEKIEIKNNSKYEVSLFGRALVSSGKVFVFPQDTIIKAGQNISFSANITGLHPTGLYDANVLVMGESVVQPNLAAKIEEQKLNKMVAIRDKIAVLQQHLTLLRSEIPSPEIAVATENSSSTPQTALVLDSVSQIKSSRINGWLETLKHFFFRTQK